MYTPHNHEPAHLEGHKPCEQMEFYFLLNSNVCVYTNIQLNVG